MKHKGVKILANCKQYSTWLLDEEGRLKEVEHSFEGADIISYTFGWGETDFETIEEVKKQIDTLTNEELEELRKY